MANRNRYIKTRNYLLLVIALTLCAGACSPPRANAVREDGRYSFIWMSDTQHYSKDYPEIFTAMTEWCLQRKDALDIRYVIHTGDIVNNYGDRQQWRNAAKALSVLTGQIPLLITAGNHDVNSSWYRYDNYLKYFGAEKFSKLDTYGESYAQGKGRYDLLDIGGTFLAAADHGVWYER